MNHTRMDDPTLVALTLAGDPSAYERLVIRYQSAVIGAATRVIGSRYLAEDAAQDAFVTAWMKLNTLREPEKFGVWVCRIARNCALNMRTRFRDYLPEETLETVTDDSDASPEEILIRSEEESLLHASIGRLPQKTAEIIRLHYFEGLSIADIAEMLRLTEGTVKWRLHEGRQRLREDLSAMNENENDTLVQRVMKKVEELKLWKLKSDKTGFEKVYENVLSDVENLPESGDKYHMMADVLLRGFWWIDGKQNDDLFAAIREAAEKGRNEDVMIFVIGKEYSAVPHGKGRNEFIRDKQIPRLEALNLPHTLAYAWFWLGYEYHRVGDTGAGFAAYDKVQDMLTPADIYYAAAIAAKKLEQELPGIREKLDDRNYISSAGGETYRIADGELYFMDEKGYAGENWMPASGTHPNIWILACLCGNRFFFNAKNVGETITDEKGRTLTYGGAGHTVVTPAGKFEDCVLWITDGGRYYGRFETYYKSGVGIVRQDSIDTYNQGFRTIYHLYEYSLVGGRGLMPVCAGNRWSYVRDCNPAYYDGLSTVEITHADCESVVVSTYVRLLRYGFNPVDWRDMAIAVRSLYIKDEPNGGWHLEDIRPQMARMKELAKTPYEIAHTKVASNVMERIFNSNAGMNPNRTEEGVWNFFKNWLVKKDSGRITIGRNGTFSFELKGNHSDAICCNFCWDILEDALGVQWDDEFAEEQERTIRTTVFSTNKPIETDLKVTKAGTVTTPAGSFSDCLELSMNIKGLSDGWAYRGGKKEYYLSPGVGIIKAVHHFEGEADAVYELCEYEGTGEGYFPAEDGFRRLYKATNLPEGDRASVEYTFVTGDDGELYMLSDQTGMRAVK